MHPHVSYFALILLAIAPSAAVLGQSNAQLKTLAERYWDARMERYPTTATANGDYRLNDRLDDLSLGGAAIGCLDLLILA